MEIIIIILVVIFIIASGVRIVSQSRAMVIERLGAYHRTMTTGVNYKIQAFESV